MCNNIFNNKDIRDIIFKHKKNIITYNFNNSRINLEKRLNKGVYSFKLFGNSDHFTNKSIHKCSLEMSQSCKETAAVLGLYYMLDST